MRIWYTRDRSSTEPRDDERIRGTANNRKGAGRRCRPAPFAVVLFGFTTHGGGIRRRNGRGGGCRGMIQEAWGARMLRRGEYGLFAKRPGEKTEKRCGGEARRHDSRRTGAESCGGGIRRRNGRGGGCRGMMQEAWGARMLRRGGWCAAAGGIESTERCAAARGVRPFCKKAWRKTRKTRRRGGNRYVEKTGSPYMGSRENRAPRVMSPEPSPRHPGRSPTQHGRFPRGLPRRSFLPEKYCRRAGCHAHNRAESARPMHRIPTLRFRSP